ncbi:MAG TPA: glycosyl hydrolase [Luteolibacter sp.]|nr:glycosyl hydrolase [Luteolibacter sp.]
MRSAIVAALGCRLMRVAMMTVGLCVPAAVAAADSGSSLDAGFRQPPASAGIRCFWWWLNGNVTAAAITRDLEEMKAKGYSGALIFDADGSSQGGHQQVPPGPLFGSPEWTALFVHACKEAKRLDLELSLNIQSGWNLGGPSVSEEDSCQQVVWSTAEVQGPSDFNKPLAQPNIKGGFYRDFRVIAVPLAAGSAQAEPIDQLPLKSSTRELGMSAPDCRPLLEDKAGKAGEPAVAVDGIIDVSGAMNAQGLLKWQVPAGRWQILRIGHAATGAHVSTHSQGWSGRVLDYLNPVALDHYWQQNIDPLMKAIGPLAGTTLRYIHTDSWEGGGMNWTPGFEQAFKRDHGYDLLPWLAVLAGHLVESREASNAFLADYRKTIAHLVANHYEHLAKLSARYGMLTHPECSGPHAGPLDGLKNYGRSGLMMSEFWSPSPHRPQPDSRFFVKQASSAAHAYGVRLVGAEGFTTIGPHWNDIPWAHMKPSFDTEFCAGLNLLFTHTFTCSPPEMGLPGQEYFAGTHFNPQVTWWNEAPAFIDYFRRCQFIAQQGSFVADVAHYYGDHIPNVFGRKGHDPAGALPGYDYDVWCEETLLQASVEQGCVALPSGMRYRVLSLPDHRILSLAALRKVESLVRAGATVLGPRPLKAVSLVGGEAGRAEFQQIAERLWGRTDAAAPAAGTREVAAGRVAWGMKASELLPQLGVLPDADLRASDGGTIVDLEWIHYRIGEGDFYFVANTGKIARSLQATLRVQGRLPELWSPLDGSMGEAGIYQTTDDGRLRLPLRLEPSESLFIVLRRPIVQAARATAPNWMESTPVHALEGPWQVGFDPALGGPAQPVTFNALDDWARHKDPAIRDYSGKAVYRQNFQLDADAAAKVQAVELGELLGVGIASVKLNGADLGVAWFPPFRLSTGKALKAGENTIEITAINSWHNRVLADSRLPEAKRLTRTNISANPKAKKFAWSVEPAGLIGPVRLVALRGWPQP